MSESGVVVMWQGTCPQGGPTVGITYADGSTPVRPDVFAVPCPAHTSAVEHVMTMQRVMAEVMCEWFAMCDQRATHLMPHPTIGHVPACDRCPNVGR